MKKRKLFKCIAIATAVILSAQNLQGFAYADTLSAYTLTSAKICIDSTDSILQSGGLLSHDGLSDTADSHSLACASDTEAASKAILDAWNNLDTTVMLSAYNINRSDIGTLYTNLINEYPQYFYVKAYWSYSYNMQDIVTSVSISYNYDTSTIESKRNKYETAVAKAIANIDSTWSDLEKALYINDYLATNCQYDTSYERHSSYDALVDETAVCQGYALAYKDLANRVG